MALTTAATTSRITIRPPAIITCESLDCRTVGYARRGACGYAYIGGAAATAAGSATGVPQRPQKAAPGASGAPQRPQYITRGGDESIRPLLRRRCGAGPWEWQRERCRTRGRTPSPGPRDDTPGRRCWV